MLKRALFLCLGFWLIAASGLAAHAGPCDMQNQPAEVAAPAEAHAHCDMMAPQADNAGQDQTESPDSSATCCCPAVLAAVPAPAAPEASALSFALSAARPADIRAPSRTLIPEPPPPKA